MKLSRRNFIKKCVSVGLPVLTVPELINISWASLPDGKVEALFYRTLPNQNVKCELCNHSCHINPNETGKCGNRLNIAGKLFTLTYSRPVAVHLDPVAKLPLKHVLPNDSLLCVGTQGCNLHCSYCINYKITQKPYQIEKRIFYSPSELVSKAKELNTPGVAFTYNEPTIAFEYMLETFKIAKEVGLKTFFHTNGMMQEAPLRELLPVTDGIVVDLKAISDRTYKALCGGNLRSVQAFLKFVYSTGCHLEIVNLLVPGVNDTPSEIAAISHFVHDHISPQVPLHFSRFFPKWKMTNLPFTASNKIMSAVEQANKIGCKFVYTNNIKNPNNHTRCPNCGKVLIKRRNQIVEPFNIAKGRCPNCNEIIPGIWEVA